MSCLQAIGHITTACHPNIKFEATKKTVNQRNCKEQDVHHLHHQNHDDSSLSSTEEYLHLVFQLGKSNHKYIVTVVINEASLDLEADSGENAPPFPGLYFKKKLSLNCNLEHL